ncbi:MAG: hypothetical protein GWM90_23080, partial [Gemmatimonadetes bacterium]|nr:hypothetical protein [Gemmatimonadota bacterium]NIU77699.1 hypothetical protein [Gammaproteobacteria bacterium]NIX46857.1 hypothetical protein [Gemmatimonadota bacterium]NIY11203.1 hypothetical protein [Gemmatimonadota bacterium]
WRGRIYGHGLARAPFARGRVFHGVWGSGLFQSIYGPAPTPLDFLTMVPEWYLGALALSVLAALGLLWAPLALPVLVLSIA